jgi:hypothetical protein
MIYPDTTRVAVDAIEQDVSDLSKSSCKPEHVLRAGESRVIFDLANWQPESLEALHLFGIYTDEE